jgi:arylsulfatase
MPRAPLPAVLLGLCLSGCGAEETPPPRPNILVLIADDLGYTDIGAFGSEIRTPNLDALAASGLRFTSFYTAAACSPTRAMLLSGVDHHRAGLGGMASLMGEDLQGRIGYEGYLNEHVFHLPAVLREAGYHTSIAGKWHLGKTEEQSPAGRGFDRSFVLLPGAASHFEDAAPVDSLDAIEYRRDGKLVPELPEGFYSTRFHTDELISYIREAEAAGQPFFAVGAYTAPHWPLQVPDEFLDLYAGAYDDGWEALAERRLAGAKRAGIVPADTNQPPLPDYARRWDDLSADEKRVEAREMELYAAMTERFDHHVGRLIDVLRETGQFDNTVIVFFSDNGASGADVSGLADNVTFLPERFDLSYENMGRINSFVYYGAEWAHAGTVPYRYFKQFAHEGGIRVPGFAVLPPSMAEMIPGATTGAFLHVTDLFPTFLEFAGAAMPTESGKIAPVGKSIVPLLRGDVAEVHEDPAAGWELFGRRAIRRGPWKAAWLAPPLGKGDWALYNLDQDPGELTDLAAERPEVLAELLGAWDDYVEENGVIVVDQDRGFGAPAPIR